MVSVIRLVSNPAMPPAFKSQVPTYKNFRGGFPLNKVTAADLKACPLLDGYSLESRVSLYLAIPTLFCRRDTHFY